MMRQRPRKRILVLGPALAAISLLLAGCPPNPLLEVSPKALSFGDAGASLSLDIMNRGGGQLRWTLEEVVRAGEGAPWVAGEIPWLDTSIQAGETAVLSKVRLTANRQGLAVGAYKNAGLRIRSNGGEAVVPVSLNILPTLTVSPARVALAPGAVSGRFNMVNLGTREAAWRVRYLENPNDPGSVQDLPADISVDPNPGSTLPGEPTPINVQWSAARQSNFALYVESEAGSSVVSFVFGAVLEGLEVRPSTVTLFLDTTPPVEDQPPVEQVASSLRISNISARTRPWLIQVISRGNPTATPPIAVTPGSGSTAPGQTSTVKVKVSNAAQVVIGSGNYELLVYEEGSTDRFVVVPVIVEARLLPKIALSEPPQLASSRPEIMPVTVLDFGREEIQQTFWVANVGPRNSRLYFRVSDSDDEVSEPLIADISPLTGGANGEDGNAADFFHPDIPNLLIDGVPITVTIDRSRLREDVEFRTITVEATDDTFQNVLDPVEPKSIQVRVERQPLTIEGALNRSRPPYVTRFVFLLRDSANQVIPTRSPEDLERITFTISEDDTPLDLSETNQFVEGSENLKVNLVLMLDYTGSMYNAGTGAGLAPGEAVGLVNNAAKNFLDDLPSSWRVALMYYNDRQQSNRLLHSFSTDRESLKAALDAFSLPPSLFGVSDIRDALMDGIDLLVAEDANDTLPFDDADMRAILFISDGYDNASVTTLNDLTSTAWDNRVRLYPLGYNSGQQVNTVDMLLMAKESNGHFYSAGNVRNLTRLLGNVKALQLEPSNITGVNRVYFKVTNAGDSTINWRVEGQAAIPWIDSVTPALGSLTPGASSTLTVLLDPGLAPPDSTVAETLQILSDNGNATASIQMTVRGVPNAIESVSLDLRDEPGIIWGELRNQIVLTYLTPKQAGAAYAIRAEYRQPDGRNIAGIFEEDGVFFPGDIRAGQIAMSTTGLFVQPNNPDPDDAVRAEVYVRTDYVPRNVSQFKMRFFLTVPEDTPPAAAAALSAAQMRVELAPQGLLVGRDIFNPSWRLLSQGDGIYVMLTEQENPIPYGAFGDLLKITLTDLKAFVDAFAGLPRQPEFGLEMRLDNDIYVSPASPGHPSLTRFFLYPAGPVNPGRYLTISALPDLAPPAQYAVDLADPGIDPEAPQAWDRDRDGLPDFDDPFPDNPGRPGSLVTPNPVEMGAAVTIITLRVRNNRLDSFTWIPVLAVEAGSPLEGRLFLDAPGAGSRLFPGESATFNVSIDRSGLPAAYYRDAEIWLDSDRFGREIVPVTVVVAN